MTDTTTLEWAVMSHPDPTVREVAQVMLEAGPNRVEQAERLAELLDDERYHVCGAFEGEL